MTDPVGRIVMNIITLQRMGTTVTKAAQPILDRAFDDIVKDLMRIDPTGPSLARWRRHRQDEFIKAAQARLAAAVPEWEAAIRSGLAIVGRNQAKFAEGMLTASLGQGVKPTPITQQRMRAILTEEPFDGHTLKELARGMGRQARDDVAREIRRGMVAEKSIGDIARSIRGKAGTWGRTARSAEGITRTAVNFVSNRGMLETYRANKKLVKRVRFSATLDDRTTLICASLDGDEWPTDSTEVQTPPLHFRCRSTLVPVPDYEAVGLKPPPDGERAARDASGNRTRVSSQVVYSEWIKKQPITMQDRMMGRSRAKLFREGKLTFKQMVTTDGRIIPLDDL